MSRSRTTYDPRRRLVLRALGVAGLTSLGAPSLAMSQARPDSARGPAASKPESAPAAAPKPPEISEDARALATIVRRRYEQHLTPDQLEAVTKEIENRIQGGKALRAAKLANGDEPDFTFHA